MTRARATDEPLQMDDDQLPVNFHIRTGERSGQQLGDIDLSKGKRVNDALPYVAASWLLSGFAIGMLAVILAVAPAYIDAKVQAGVAKADASANTARQDARIALDKVEQTQVQLGAKGLIQPSMH